MTESINKEWLHNQYINLEKSTRQIAKEFNYSKSRIAQHVKNFGFSRSISEATTGDKSGQWKGDKVKYSALHKWIKKRKGKPKCCELCGAVEKRIELSSKTHEYTRDLNEYQYFCCKCHYKYDLENGLKNA